MATVTLKYIDSSSVTQSQSFSALSVKGFEEPEKIQLWPPRIITLADHSMRTEYRGFRRVVTADLGVVGEAADRRFIQNFLMARSRSMVYQGTATAAEEMIVAFADTEFETDWTYGTSLNKRVVLDLVERAIRNLWYNYTPVDTTDIMYIKLKVQIDGTQDSPETFVTNAGKLLKDSTGRSYPSISLVSYVVTVFCNASPYQECMINQVGDVVQSGSDISFQLARSNAGNPSGDGNYYCDIVLGLQAR